MFSVNAVRLAFGTQAARLTICQKVIRVCTHKQSLYKLYDFTYESMWTKKYRYEVTFELTRITKISTQCYIGINILLLLFCDYTMYIFLFQTSSLVSFNVCFSFGQMSSDFTLLIFFNVINTF